METIPFLAFCAVLAQVLFTISALGSKYLSLSIRTITLRVFTIDLLSFSFLLDYSQMHRKLVYSFIHSFIHATTVIRK